MRADEDANQKIAEQCRQLQNPEDHHDRNGRGKQQKHKFEDSETHGVAQREKVGGKRTLAQCFFAPGIGWRPAWVILDRHDRIGKSRLRAGTRIRPART